MVVWSSEGLVGGEMGKLAKLDMHHNKQCPYKYAFNLNHKIVIKPNLMVYNGGACNGPKDDRDQIRCHQN